MKEVVRNGTKPTTGLVEPVDNEEWRLWQQDRRPIYNDDKAVSIVCGNKLKKLLLGQIFLHVINGVDRSTELTNRRSGICRQGIRSYIGGVVQITAGPATVLPTD